MASQLFRARRKELLAASIGDGLRGAFEAQQPTRVATVTAASQVSVAGREYRYDNRAGRAVGRRVVVQNGGRPAAAEYVDAKLDPW